MNHIICTTGKFSVSVLLILMLIAASATSLNNSISIFSYGRITIPFGKNTPGDDYWYVDTSSMGHRKVGTKYNNLKTSDFNTIFARFSNWPNWNYSYPKVKAGIIDSGGNLLDVSVNEVSLQPVVLFEHLWHGFRLSKNLTLLPGDYYLVLWVGGYGALAYSCAFMQQPASFIIEEDYDNPMGTIGSLTIQRNFDIFAVYTEDNIPPRAIIKIITSITSEVGSTITFDGSISRPGFRDTDETQIVSYEWDFGDETTGTGATVQKIYSSIGDYKVTLRVTDSQGRQDTETTMVWVKPVGGYTSFTADFENAGDFAVGIEHSGNYKYWDREKWFMDIRPDAYRFSPETTIVHSGTRSAKLELVNPIDDQSRRLQLLHDWEPYTEHVWIETWHYFPEDFEIGGWVTIHKTITERYWGSNGTWYYHNGHGVAFGIDGRSDRPTYGQPIFVLQRGQAGGPGTPDNFEFYPDLYPSDWQQTDWPHEWINGPKWVPVFGDWFMIRTHAYRNVYGDWNQGKWQVWMAFPPDYEEELIFETTERTIGIDPQLLENVGWNHNPDGSMAYVASGTALYTALPAVSKYCYLDDVILSNSETFPPST